MDGGTADCGALSESIVFLGYFKDLSDPRQQGKVIYPLNEVLLLCLLAVLAGAETFTDIALFGEKKLDLLRRFLPFRNGAPAHDRLGEIFAVLDAEVFQRCFVSWVAAMTGFRRKSSPLTARLRADPAKTRAPTTRSTWFLPLPRSSVWCLGRRRWMRSPMRSLPSPNC